jgi:hypothetical protein
MAKKSFLATYHRIIGLSIMVFGVAAGVLLVGQVQDVREKAAVPGGQATVTLTPTTGSYSVGDTIKLQVYFDTHGISTSGIAIRLVSPFSGDNPPITVSSIDINPDILATEAWHCPSKTWTVQGGNLVVDVACANVAASGFTTNGNALLATVNLKVLSIPSQETLSLRFDPQFSVLTRKDTGEDVLAIPASSGTYAIGNFRGPVLYFVPAEINVPISTSGLKYDLYLDTRGYEVNGAVFEIKFDTSLLLVTDVLPGDIFRLVQDHYVEGGKAYLSVILADETKPFNGIGRVAIVEFETFQTPARTLLTFDKNTQIHTKGMTSNILDKAIPGVVIIGLQQTATPTPTGVVSTPTFTPTATPTPTPFCDDTDGGNNIFIKGSVTTNDGTYTDYCQDVNTVVEYSCAGSAPPYSVAEGVADCTASGYLCEDGACTDPINLTNTPTPTPGVCVPGELPGDANGDCIVSGEDYAIWFEYYGQYVDGGASQGDFDNDGFVDGKDYGVWFIHYGEVITS